MKLKVINNGQAASGDGPWRLFIEIRQGADLPALVIYGRTGASSRLTPLAVDEAGVRSRRNSGLIKDWRHE